MKRTLTFLLLFTSLLSVSAQKQAKGSVKAKKPTTETVSPGEKLFRQMLGATAKVMFIDSVVVDKAGFMAHLPLNEESGSLQVTNPQADVANQMVCYQNEFGDRRILAGGDSVNSALYTQTMLAGNWSKPQLISDFDTTTYKLENYPFLAVDGVTLFFSAEGPESMGGRDIFMSTFNSDEAKWYNPQNYGLPFNSTANDYLLAINDLDTLGWLVSDRNQPEGKVCIYTFVPTETRQNFDDDDLDDDSLAAYARIKSIKETWMFGDRKAAMNRRDAMLKRLNARKQSASAMSFVINDKKTITSPSQFSNEESRRLYLQVVELRQMIEKTQSKLANERIAYHDGNQALSGSIRQAEHDLEQQKADLVSLEKKIRSLEN